MESNNTETSRSTYPRLSIDDFFEERNESSKRKLELKKKPAGWRLIFFKPEIRSNHFLMTCKLSTVDGKTNYVNSGGLEIGVCCINHPRAEKSGREMYHGQHGGKGWGWLYGSRNIFCHDRDVSGKPTMNDIYYASDIISVEVNRKKKTLSWRKGFGEDEKVVGVLTNQEIPPALFFSMAVYYPCEVELLRYVDFDRSSQNEEDEKERRDYLVFDETFQEENTELFSDLRVPNTEEIRIPRIFFRH